jgi:hypothetical protein
MFQAEEDRLETDPGRIHGFVNPLVHCEFGTMHKRYHPKK